MTEIIYDLLGTNAMLAGVSEFNTPGKFYEYLRGPMSTIYAGDSLSGDDFLTTGENFFNGLRLLEDISIRQIRVTGRPCGKTARVLFDENICFDNTFILDASQEEKIFSKTNADWVAPIPLGSSGTTLFNYSRSAWIWSSAADTQESRFLAKYHIYPASGYQTKLPRNGTSDFIKHLEANYWVDPKTTAIIVSLAFYSSTLVLYMLTNMHSTHSLILLSIRFVHLQHSCTLCRTFSSCIGLFSRFCHLAKCHHIHFHPFCIWTDTL